VILTGALKMGDFFGASVRVFPLGSIIVVPAVTLALFLSFAALYLALFNAAPSSFYGDLL
jgi:hypothetical protein